MILNDRQIAELACSQVLIEPFYGCQVREFTKHADSLNEKVISFGLSSFGYDIRADYDWKVFANIYGGTVVDPKDFDERSFVSISDDHCIIPGNSFALTSSIEKIKMSKNLLGLCIGKSTYARCGIIVNVTPIEPGWEGYITIEVSNTTPLPVKVYSGEGIAQLLFFEGSLPSTSYAARAGKYMNQPKQVILPKL